MTPRKSHLCDTIALPSPWPYYSLPCICVPSFAIGRSAFVALWCSSESTSFLTGAIAFGLLSPPSLPRPFRPPASTPLCPPSSSPWSMERQTATLMHGLCHFVAELALILFSLASLVTTFTYSALSSDLSGSLKRM
ncbi:hypothetical protein GW17_00060465 [Ensete ventricosum]|nr:hypothetical protein GW17_00060465 [Ensete ventricosum]